MPESILTVDCQCGKTIKVRSTSAGKKVRCPKCETVVAIPAVGDAPTDTAKEIQSTSLPKPKAAAVVSSDSKPLPKSPQTVSPDSFKLDLGETNPPDLPAASVSLQPPDIQPTPIGDLHKPVTDPSSPATSTAVVAETTGTAGPGSPTSDSPDGKLNVTVSADNPYAASDHAPPPARSYPALQTIRRVYKVLGYLTLFGAICFAAIVFLVAVGGGNGALVAITSAGTGLIFGIITGVSLIAISEVIQVVLDIQDNTYRNANR